MIRVTIDLVPYGNEDLKRQLHIIEIWNDLMDSHRTRGRHGSYKYRIGRKGGGTAKEGQFGGFPRTRQNAVRLLKRVLDDAYPEG